MIKSMNRNQAIPVKTDVPKISVVMSVYNAEKYLVKAVESILNQTYQDFEFIIINDASTDTTEGILRQFADPRLRIFKNSENLGLSKSLNKAIELAVGIYIARMDSDDISLPHRFETQLRFLEANDDYALVGSSYLHIDDNGMTIGINNVPLEDATLRKKLKVSNCFAHGSIMMSKKSVQEVGGYDEKYIFSQDYDLWLRMSEIGKVANIREPLYCWRVTRSCISVERRKEQKYYANLALSEARNREGRRSIPQSGELVGKNRLEFESTPLVSVIIPCYNHAHFLEEAIESVIGQTHKNWECIIVNDGSTDNTGEVARKFVADHPGYSISLIEKENGGLASARNAGINAAQGLYILPLDADDLIAPTMIEKCVNLLESNPDFAIAYTFVQQFGAYQCIVPLTEYDFNALCTINFMNATALFRREAFDAVGGYNTNMLWGYEDWDFWISCGEKGFYGQLISEPLFLRRMSEDSMVSKSLQYDKVLKAQIILNHPSLYTKSQIVWADGITAHDCCVLSLP